MLRIAALCLVLLAFAPAIAAGDGAPDPSFGHAGSLSFGPQRFSSASGIAIDAQGRTLVVAMLEDGSMLRTQVALLRLQPDGSLDPSFGSGGIAAISAPAPYLTLRAEATAVDAQGRIVIAGEVDEDIMAVVRVLPDGRPDPAFGSGGIFVARGAYGGLPGAWQSVAIDGSRIVVAGSVDDGPPFGPGLGPIAVVARLGDNGLPDAGFATGGFLELPISGLTDAFALAADPAGRIVMSIWHATRSRVDLDRTAEIVRLTDTGSLDTTFGAGGRFVLGYGAATSLRLRPTGQIVVLGDWRHTLAITVQPPVMAAQLLPSGRLDRAFGNAGELIPKAASAPGGGALDCQGDLLVSTSAGVSRFGPDGRLDPTFRAGVIPPVAVGDTIAPAKLGFFAFTSAGAILLAGSAVDGPSVVGGTSPSGHYAIAVARLAATCPVVDSTPPTVTLTCTAGCRRVAGSALDDPVGGGVRRVLLGVERITGKSCQAWNGRRFTRLPCGQAARLLVPVALARAAFRVPSPGQGASIVRAVAIDRAGNRSRTAVRRISR